jgi:hypothetical protein
MPWRGGGSGRMTQQQKQQGEHHRCSRICSAENC